MITSWKHVARWMSASLSILFLGILLTACGGGGSTGSATPTAQAPTATPTTAAAPTTAAPQLQTYTGTGFTIEYPQSWKVQTVQGAVVFTDAQQENTLTIATGPNPGGAVDAAQALKTGLDAAAKAGNLTGVQPVSLPSTTTVGGETWAQGGITGNATVNGAAVPVELVSLAVNHPANSPTTRTYDLVYGGPSISFQQENTLVFQPMLQTFKFTA